MAKLLFVFLLIIVGLVVSSSGLYQLVIGF